MLRIVIFGPDRSENRRVRELMEDRLNLTFSASCRSTEARSKSPSTSAAPPGTIRLGPTRLVYHRLHSFRNSELGRKGNKKTPLTGVKRVEYEVYYKVYLSQNPFLKQEDFQNAK